MRLAVAPPPDPFAGGCAAAGKDLVMSVTSPVPPAVRAAGISPGPSRLGYWIGGGLVAAAFLGAAVWVVLAFFGFMTQVNGFQRMTVPGTATVQVTQAATRVLYVEGPRAAAPVGQLGIRVTGPGGNAVAVAAYHGDLRYDVPGESGRGPGRRERGAHADHYHGSAPVRGAPLSGTRHQGPGRMPGPAGAERRTGRIGVSGNGGKTGNCAAGTTK